MDPVSGRLLAGSECCACGGALSHFVLWPEPLPIDTAAHWWMMQVWMIVGFFTAWPVNVWLIRRGWKEKVDRRSRLAPMVRARREAAIA